MASKFLQRWVCGERSIVGGVIKARQILLYNPPGANIHMTNFRIANLSFW
jgi:hypothetical protein